MKKLVFQSYPIIIKSESTVPYLHLWSSRNSN